MKTIHCLFVVDTSGVVASGSLQDNIYCVDSNGYLGSWGEGTKSLHTVCREGQTICWSATSVSPGNSASLTGFSGHMILSGVCIPKQVGSETNPSWQGQVQSRGQFATFTFTASIKIDGRVFQCNGAIKVV
ncbi:hypothetical protein CSA56_05380 [candidate division KSB3 bacterium]|uniref:Uncharacterized protein n=1 Tax=candidate division KSB3 bacterium TaxID=2044937 RepID=A0A2G6KHJ2_9BACT|nr:MAG: hypothetical protein CSA56_05380 [candidate division KSB3 bacterium]